jgi:putative ABC transport system permease protein
MGFWQDLRFAVRNLLKQRGFSAVALLTLALGIGANTAVFSVIRHVLLAPLPYRDADRLVDVWSQWRNFDKTWVSDADAFDYQTRVTAFESAGAWGGTQVNLTGDGDPIRVGAAVITANLFDVLGAPPLLGRAFTAAEADAAQPTVVILSYDMWQQRFGGASDILTRTVMMNGRQQQVVGVMPSGFQLPTDYVVNAEEPTRLYLPYKLDKTVRGSHGLYAAARLRPGATVASANAELAVLAQKLVDENQYPKAMQFRAFALSVNDEAFGAVRPALLLVVGAVAFLLLIACTNVANLLLVRADARSREIAVRTALGAHRWRIIRQLITEGAVLAVIAAVLGVTMAAGALKLLVGAAGTSLPRLETVGLDVTVLAFSLATSLVTLVLFSLVPAIRTARVDLVDSLKDGSQNASSGLRKQRLRGALVVTEMALAVVMLTGAGLMLRSLWSLQHVDLGINPDRVLTMRLALPASTYDTPDKVVGFYDQLVQGVRALPNVERAGLIRLIPLAQEMGDWGLDVEGYQPPPGVGTPGDWQVASSGGPEALGERLVAGRWLADADTSGREDVGLINEAMANKYWAGRSALGGRFKMSTGMKNTWVTVVGIVGNVRHNGITSPIKPKFYVPVGQFHESTGRPQRTMALVVKTTGDPMTLVGPVRSEIRRLDANLPIAAVQSMQDVVNHAVATQRLTGWLLGVFASLALALAAVGIYGVLSYVVSQRRQEIGIRMAIGASRGQVLRMILRNGLMLAACGLAAGLAASAALSRYIASLLHDVSPFDPVTFGLVSLVLLVVAASACLLPALRATRVSPVSALRAD